MPRPYRLGERATQVEATRGRIVDAAIDLYAELGITGTTMSEIGRRADVAPGTLRNHFPSRDDLDRAMVQRLTAEAPLPELSIFDGADSVEARIERLVRAATTFFERSARLQRMWNRERLLTSPWMDAGASYGARWDQLFRAALGLLADDPDAMAMIRAVLDPSFVERVRGGTRSNEQVAALITATIAPWFSIRLAERTR